MTWIPQPDEDGRLFDNYKIVIRRTSDGEERTAEMKMWHRASRFWWTRGEGNGGCDCNRYLFFERVKDPDFDGDCECDHAAYEVVRFEFPDGTSLDGDFHKNWDISE